ncbi:hypothetical protein Tco_1386689 [Tanacetum coccineum]
MLEAEVPEVEENDKSTEDEPGKLNVEAEVVMVTVLIYQASSSVPPLSTPVIDLLPPKPASSTTQAQSLQLQQQPAPLKDRFRDLPKADMKEMLHQRMFETGSYKLLPEHVALYEALEAFMKRAQMDEFFAERGKSRKRRRDDQDPPPPPPDLDLCKKKRHDSSASGSLQPLAPQSSTWKMTDTREAPSSSSKQLSGPHAEQLVEDILIPNTANISDSEDTDSAHLLKIKQSPEWLKRILEEDRPKTPKLDWSVPPNDLPKPENNQENALANSYKDLEENKLVQKTSDIGSFITWFCKRIGKKKLSKSDLEGPTYKVAKAFHENNISLQFQMEKYHRMLTDQVNLVNPEGHRLVPDVRKPLPQGGPPGQKISFIHIQLKVAQYLDFRLEELVSSLWIESEREYDIGAAYGISHWWFKHREFYITRHSAPSDRSTVRSHIRIFSVVSLKTYERFGYAFLKEIVLRRADYKEYKISEADFKNLHLNDFEDLYLLHLQGTSSSKKCVEDLQLDIESYQIKLNLTQPDWDASDFLFKEDYTIVSKPRAVIYKDKNDQKKMMRETKVHKFSDDTVNKGMETRIWFEDDRRRSKDFMEVVERRLKIRRIFKSLESFVGGRLRDVDYRLIQRTE